MCLKFYGVYIGKCDEEVVVIIIKLICLLKVVVKKETVYVEVAFGKYLIRLEFFVIDVEDEEDDVIMSFVEEIIDGEGVFELGSEFK